jgi:MFS transporter, ACS family, D-galactonate transporter
VVGLVIFGIALVGLRELSPQLRDQLMVSLRDRALIEARAAGIDPERALTGHWRQMLRLDVIGSAFAISVFLFIYYFAVGFLVIYCATVFGYSLSRANALANWYWITQVIVLLATGLLSDKLRVRKPFMLGGAVIGLVGVGLFAVAATKPHTSYYTLATYVVLAAAGNAIGYCAWMAAFTETVEKRNPAATATGLAVWGWIIRVVYTFSLLAFMLVVTAPSTLVDKGGRVQSIVAAHPKEIAVLSAVDPASAAALAKNPTDPVALPVALAAVARQQGAAPATVAEVQAATARRIDEFRTAGAIDPGALAKLSLNPPDMTAFPTAQREVMRAFGISESQALQRLGALGAAKADLALVQPYVVALQSANTAIPAADLAFLSANAAQVQKAAADSPRQWQRWFWVVFAAQLVFVPFIFVMAGRWSPRRARADVREHERLVEREMQLLLADESGAVGTTTPAGQLRTR